MMKTNRQFINLVAEMERERGYRIGGFALVEKTGEWKIIRPNGKTELLEDKGEKKND